MAKFYAKAPDGSDALLSIVLTGFTQSLQQNGWCKLPNGLLIQWTDGEYGIHEGNPYKTTWYFPISLNKYLTCIFGACQIDEFAVGYLTPITRSSISIDVTIVNETALGISYMNGYCIGY